MADRVSKHVRSRIMRGVKSKDTSPEMKVRSLLHSMGYRYRLHRKDLPGSPDLAFYNRGKVIFVHGCFWHRHACRNGRSIPESNREFWERKFSKNRERDRAVRNALRKLGWKYLIVWECWLRNDERLKDRLVAFLGE